MTRDPHTKTRSRAGGGAGNRGAGARLLQVAARGADGVVLHALSAGQRSRLEQLLREVDDAYERGHTVVTESAPSMSEVDRAIRGDAFDIVERLAQAAQEDLGQDRSGTLRLIGRANAEQPLRTAYALRGEPGQRTLSTARSADDERRMAAGLVARAAQGQLQLLTGGPGTGKTFSIARLVLARLASVPERSPPRIHVMAPTGRAAARLREQLDAELRASAGRDGHGRVTFDSVTISTIHSALQWRPAPGSPFAHTALNPLPTDLAIVDECSMVDLALMRRMLEAIPATATLVLVGDADQLASVEAGSVFRDCCSAPALGGALVRLTKNYRTAGDPRASWLAALVEAVRGGESERVLAALREQDALLDPSMMAARGGAGRSRAPRLTDLVVDHAEPIYRALLDATADDALAAFDALRRFRVLSATRGGDGGVDAVCDRLDERLLGGAGEQGRQVMILENDRESDLANGDMGVVVQGGVVVGRRADGSARILPRASLPSHASAWAISIHKSQGSEFDRVIVVLPEDASPILSRQLLYTALTRSRGQIQVVAHEASVRAAVSQEIRRSGGLSEAIARCAERSRRSARADHPAR